MAFSPLKQQQLQNEILAMQLLTKIFMILQHESISRFFSQKKKKRKRNVAISRNNSCLKKFREITTRI